MSEGKHDRDLVEFMYLFSKIKTEINNEPGLLLKAVEVDDLLEEDCVTLYWLTFSIKIDEKRGRKLFRNPVNHKFIIEWRDYEDNWKDIIDELGCNDLLQDLPLPLLGTIPNELLDPKRKYWQKSDDLASSSLRGFSNIMDQAEQSVDVDFTQFPENYEEYCQDILNSIKEFKELPAKIGIDLRGILRRRQLVPITLIPSHVASRHGNTYGPPPDNSISLTLQLQQAHEAFVYGLPLVAITHLRAIIELVLKYHYELTDEDLGSAINSYQRGEISKINKYSPVRPEMERSINRLVQSLHDIRILSNDILHNNSLSINYNKNIEDSNKGRRKKILETIVLYTVTLSGAASCISQDEICNAELSIISYFNTARVLIEKAPVHTKTKIV